MINIANYLAAFFNAFFNFFKTPSCFEIFDLRVEIAFFKDFKELAFLAMIDLRRRFKVLIRLIDSAE